VQLAYNAFLAQADCLQGPQIHRPNELLGCQACITHVCRSRTLRAFMLVERVAKTSTYCSAQQSVKRRSPRLDQAGLLIPFPFRNWQAFASFGSPPFPGLWIIWLPTRTACTVPISTREKPSNWYLHRCSRSTQSATSAAIAATPSTRTSPVKWPPIRSPSTRRTLTIRTTLGCTVRATVRIQIRTETRRGRRCSSAWCARTGCMWTTSG
jgi:hypothetical protein